MTGTTTLFGVGVSNAMGGAAGSAPGGAGAAGGTPEVLRLAAQADRGGLDLFSVSDHPYVGGRFDAYAAVGVALGGTGRVSGLVNVSNLPSRPAPMLARTVASLSALTGGRFVLGLGAGGRWDDIVRLGVPRLDPAAAVRALEESITLIRALCGGGPPVTFDGEFHRVDALEPAPVPAPRIWTGSVGQKSLAVTGRVADGWIPGHAADWLSARYRESRPVIDDAAHAVGRAPADIATVFNFPGVITPGPLAATRDRDGRWVGGSAEQWVEELVGAVREFGAGGFIHFPVGEASAEDQLGRWASEVVPAVRERIAA